MKMAGRFGRYNTRTRLSEGYSIVLKIKRLDIAGMVVSAGVKPRDGQKNDRFTRSYLGEKIPPNFLHFFMFLRMVPTTQPMAMSDLAILFAYQLLVFPGFSRFNSRYFFCQLACLACVSNLRASRLTSLGV